MEKITPCLWFDDQAEETANYYVSIFKNSKILNIARYDEAGSKAAGKPVGSVMTVIFQLDGQNFMALNGGPQFTFSPAVSFMINCETQEEVDELWGKLSEAGSTGQCSWLDDKFGVSWQIVPTILGKLLTDKNAEKSQSVMKALLQMSKLNIRILEEAYMQG